jgi:hypothetical protein
MNDVHPRFQHQCFVSFNKFDQSMGRVVDYTFKEVKFDRTVSVTPTYIGVEVDCPKDEEMQKVIRRFFERLRSVHQNHFVRFVTDTVWATESHNGDIFYCHDGGKRERADIIWSIRVKSKGQIEVNIISAPDNRRREILTDLQVQLNKLYKADPDSDVGPQLGGIMDMFYSRTKNIRALEFLNEDCHLILMPLPCGLLFRPVIICGMSQLDAKRRWRNITGQICYQNHQLPRVFGGDTEITDLLRAGIDLMCINGELDEKHFCPRTHYEAVELAFTCYDGPSAFSRTPHDVIILHTMKNGNIWTNRGSLDYLSAVN